MKFDEIKTGTKLELELYDDNNEIIKPVFISQFEEYLDGGIVEVYAPIHEGQIYPVHRGTIMNVCFNINGETFLFKAKAKDRVHKGRIAMLHIEPTTQISKVQRREFFRLECMLGIKYRIFESMRLDPEERGEFKNAVTSDISGGGLCIILDEAPEKRSFIECCLALGEEVRFIGQIMRVITVSTGKYSKYEVGIQFKKIENRDREKLISYIFETQRNLLKKGWSRI